MKMSCLNQGRTADVTDLVYGGVDRCYGVPAGLHSANKACQLLSNDPVSKGAGVAITPVVVVVIVICGQLKVMHIRYSLSDSLQGEARRCQYSMLSVLDASLPFAIADQYVGVLSQALVSMLAI